MNSRRWYLIDRRRYAFFVALEHLISGKSALGIEWNAIDPAG